MANVKVSELREAVKKDKNETRTVEYDGITIEVKKYIPIQEKLSIAESIYQASVDTENGLHVVDDNSVDMAFRVLLVDSYTNLTLPKVKVEGMGMVLDIPEAYNLLCESGLYNKIYNAISDDEITDLYVIVKQHIRTKKDKYEQENNITYIIKQSLEGLIDNIPTPEETKKMVEELSKEVENLDIDKLNFVKDFVEINSGGK